MHFLRKRKEIHLPALNSLSLTFFGRVDPERGAKEFFIIFDRRFGEQWDANNGMPTFLTRRRLKDSDHNMHAILHLPLSTASGCH